jgi:hypothetical protein
VRGLLYQTHVIDPLAVGRAACTLLLVDATGYQGEVAIDPATGTIPRLTVQADLAFDSTIFRGDIMVEYGPVEIDGKTYTCPIRRVCRFRSPQRE